MCRELGALVTLDKDWRMLLEQVRINCLRPASSLLTLSSMASNNLCITRGIYYNKKVSPMSKYIEPLHSHEAEFMGNRDYIIRTFDKEWATNYEQALRIGKYLNECIKKLAKN